MQVCIQFPALTRPLVFKHMLVICRRNHVRKRTAEARADVDPDASADAADGPGEADERIRDGKAEGGEVDGR